METDRTISLVRAFETMLKRVVFDALEGARDDYYLGAPTCRRPFLPGFALPRRLAVRRPAPSRLVCSSLEFRFFVFRRVVQDMCVRYSRRYEGRSSPGRTDLSVSRPSAPPRPAALSYAALPTRP